VYGVLQEGNGDSSSPRIVAVDDRGVIVWALANDANLCIPGSSYKMSLDGDTVIYLFVNNDQRNLTFLAALWASNGTVLWVLELESQISNAFTPVIADVDNKSVILTEVDYFMGYNFLGAVGCCSGHGNCSAVRLLISLTYPSTITYLIFCFGV